jgi:hypothetical protein
VAASGGAGRRYYCAQKGDVFVTTPQPSGGSSERGLRLDPETAARAFGAGYFNLIRRGADGSLRLSSDHWRLEHATAEVFRFCARDQDAPPLEVRLEHVERLIWDRLPKQQVRSQIRFLLANGDLWTFSGTVDESALPDR